MRPEGRVGGPLNGEQTFGVDVERDRPRHSHGAEEPFGPDHPEPGGGIAGQHDEATRSIPIEAAAGGVQ